jgi:hypothetical protein
VRGGRHGSLTCRRLSAGINTQQLTSPSLSSSFSSTIASLLAHLIYHPHRISQRLSCLGVSVGLCDSLTCRWGGCCQRFIDMDHQVAGLSAWPWSERGSSWFLDLQVGRTSQAAWQCWPCFEVSMLSASCWTLLTPSSCRRLGSQSQHSR